MDQRCGSSGSAPALQMRSPEFNPRPIKKEKKRKSEIIKTLRTS
jgi:hypothetical protein